MLSIRDPSLPLFGYAPGHYDARCFACGQVFSNADKRAVQCHPCALATLDERQAKLDAGEIVLPEGEAIDTFKPDKPISPEVRKIVEDFALRWSERNPEAAAKRDADRRMEKIKASEISPRPGQTVKFSDGRIGIVCEPNDPAREGTYSGTKFGDIPIKFDRRNRKERRKAAHDKRHKKGPTV